MIYSSMKELLTAGEIFAFCETCDIVLAEIDPDSLGDLDKFGISRRVVYESAQRHAEQSDEHEVFVYDPTEDPLDLLN